MIAKKDSKQRTLKNIKNRVKEDSYSFKKSAESLKEIGEDEILILKKKAAIMEKKIQKYINENPEKSVLIAAGIGAVVGAMFASAMKRRG